MHSITNFKNTNFISLLSFTFGINQKHYKFKQVRNDFKKYLPINHNSNEYFDVGNNARNK